MTIKRRIYLRRQELVKKFPDGSVRIRYEIPISKRIYAAIFNSYRNLLNALTKKLSFLMGFVFFLGTFLMVKESDYQMIHLLNDTFLQSLFIKSENKSDMIMSISTGLFAGFFVWLFDSYLPEFLKLKKCTSIVKVVFPRVFEETERLFNFLNNDILCYETLMFRTVQSNARTLSFTLKRLDNYITELSSMDKFWDFDTALYFKELELLIKDNIYLSESIIDDEEMYYKVINSSSDILDMLCAILSDEYIYKNIRSYHTLHMSEFSQFLSRKVAVNLNKA